MSKPMMTSALAINSRFLPVRFKEWVLGKFKRAPKSITGIDKQIGKRDQAYHRVVVPPHIVGQDHRILRRRQ